MNQTDWIAISAVVSAVATVVLTIITGVYVYLTYRLVRAQEQGFRLQAQELAVRALATTLSNKRPQIQVLSKRFPLDLTKEPFEPDFESSDLETFQYELGAATAQLPQSLASLCHKATLDLNVSNFERDGPAESHSSREFSSA